MPRTLTYSSEGTPRTLLPAKPLCVSSIVSLDVQSSHLVSRNLGSPQSIETAECPSSLYLPPLSGNLLTDHLDQQYYQQRRAGLIPTPLGLIRIGRHIRRTTALGNA